MRCAPIRCHLIRYISVSFLFRSFANSKTLAAIVSKNIRCSFSDNAVTSGVPTATTSSFVFSICITSSRLIFEGQKNTPHYLGSKTAKSKGFVRNFFKKFSFWLVLPLPDRPTAQIIHFYLRVARVCEGTLFRIKTVTVGILRRM